MRYLTILSLILIMACNKPEIVYQYPVTTKVDTIDTYFDVRVADPYRWLEDDRSDATLEWVKKQNEVTFTHLQTIPFKDNLRKRLEELVNYERVFSPFVRGNYTYYYKNNGLQNQNVLYRKRNGSSQEEIFIDPNTFSDKGTVALSSIGFSQDGKFATVLTSNAGSDWQQAVILDTETRKPIDDTIKYIKFSGTDWLGNKGFFYSSYGKPTVGKELIQTNDNHKVYFHTLGSLSDSDIVVFGNNEKFRTCGASVSEDHKYVSFYASEGTSGNKLWIAKSDQLNSIRVIVDNFDQDHFLAYTKENDLWLYTNLNAPNGRIVKTAFDKPTPDTWIDVIPETKEVLDFSTCGKKIFARYLQDAKTVVKRYDLEGKFEMDVTLPGIGTASGFYGFDNDTVTYFSFTSFNYPTTIFSYHIPSGKVVNYAKPKVNFDPLQYEVEQKFTTSKDGTRIPMFIVSKKGLLKNSKNPTHIYSYGGFNISMQPSFSATNIAWLEAGGVYVLANIRGGGEYVEEWHKAGTKMNKQNVFDDFIAAIQYVQTEKYTSPSYTVISGGSNGGLLIGAVMTQQPELMKVAIPRVGVLDMLRYHRFTIGAAWATDYGKSDDSKEMFNYLYNYSPLHQIKENTLYPATLILTADHDDRVVPAHSFKFAATLQEKSVKNRPAMIRIETDAGHGAGKPLSKQLDETADMFAFAWYHMNVTPKFENE